MRRVFLGFFFAPSPQVGDRKREKRESSGGGELLSPSWIGSTGETASLFLVWLISPSFPLSSNFSLPMSHPPCSPPLPVFTLPLIWSDFPPTLLTAEHDLLPAPLLSHLTHSPTHFPQGCGSLLYLPQTQQLVRVVLLYFCSISVPPKASYKIYTW